MQDTAIAEAAAPKVHALGYSQTEFNPARPGRLCRGRERWIEPWEIEDPPVPVRRLVISGAAFSDDSARDALRGLPYSEIDLAGLIDRLFPDSVFLAFMEDGHPADIPEQALGVEAYEGYRAGGHSEIGLVRWYQRVQGEEQLRKLLGSDPMQFTDRVRGFALVDEETDDEALFSRLFSLVGMSCLDSPPAHYQPAALPEVLELTEAVVVIHRDKHGPALGVYSRDVVDTEAALAALCEPSGTLLVRFAIPPMLARWDRALSEAREEWHASRDDEFPVPPAPEPSEWSSRRQRKKGRRGGDGPSERDRAEEKALEAEEKARAAQAEAQEAEAQAQDGTEASAEKARKALERARRAEDKARKAREKAAQAREVDELLVVEE